MTQTGGILAMGRMIRTGGAEIVYRHADIDSRFRKRVDRLESIAKRQGPKTNLRVKGIFESRYALSPREHEAALWTEGRPGPYLVDSLTWARKRDVRLQAVHDGRIR